MSKKKIFVYLFIGLIASVLFNFFSPFRTNEKKDTQEIIFSDFLIKVKHGEVTQVTLKDNKINGILKDGTPFETYSVNYPDLIKVLEEKNIRIEVSPAKQHQFLLVWGPYLFLSGFFIFLIWSMRHPPYGKIGKSQARVFTDSDSTGTTRAGNRPENRGEHKKVTFADVAGLDEAKTALKECVEFLRDPNRFLALGARIPRGILLTGPPGTGKTLLAKATSGEANVPFFYASGSEFVEMFVGVGASRVRDLFRKGKENAPCIIFIDEIDAVGRRRGVSSSGGETEKDQTLDQLLTEINGFEDNNGIIVIAATNRADMLDPALIRRFDDQITLPLPRLEYRDNILKIHTQNKPLNNDVNLMEIAINTPGKTGSDLDIIANQAALFAGMQKSTKLQMKHFDQALQRAGATIPVPQSIQEVKNTLDRWVVGQDDAKIALAKAINIHFGFARKNSDTLDMIDIKPTLLFVGGHGVGKTFLIRKLADELHIPFSTIEAIKLDDINHGERALQVPINNMIQAAGGNHRKAEYGIICIYGLDKLASNEANKASFWSYSIQESLINMIRGEKLKISMTQEGRDLQDLLFDTRNILFICEGQFPMLMRKDSESQNLPENISPFETRKLVEYGFLPELVSMLTMPVRLNPLTKEDIIEILNMNHLGSISDQYQKLLEAQGYEVEFNNKFGNEIIAFYAVRLGLGGRGLHQLMHGICQAVLDETRRKVIIDDKFMNRITPLWEAYYEHYTGSDTDAKHPGSEADGQIKDLMGLPKN
jgi:ATP-dependent Zn protease